MAGSLLLLGVVLAVLAEPVTYSGVVVGNWALALLVPAYIAGTFITLDFEVRNNSYSVTLVHLPLALGVLLVAPELHLGARLLASLVFVVVLRQAPVKALYNLGTAALEVGLTAFAVSQLGVENGPLLWLALYLGHLVSDLFGALVLAAIWRVLGLTASLGHTLTAHAVTAPVSVIFTGLAVVAAAAFKSEPMSAVVMAMLTTGLGVAYRAHRRTVTRQATTEQLYEFVKDLGPLNLRSAAAEQALEQVRLLIGARRLDLAVRRGDHWQHVQVAEGAAPERSVSASPPPMSQVTETRTATLGRTTRGSGGAQTMATPLVDGAGLLGVLTADERLSAARAFDMGDLRLLETVASELGTALERGTLLEELQRAASEDPLTRLPNLPETSSRLEALLADEGCGVLVAAVAVDSFREVNDTLGHAVGDDLLLEVARRLERAYPDALIGRIGGGRFAVVTTSDGALDAGMFGLGIRAQVEGGAQIGAVGTHIRLSVGVVSAPDHGNEAPTLLRRAETAMYSARHAHGGPVVWEPAYEVEGQRRLAVVTALREALASGAIGLAYQPKVDTVTGSVTGVEALARWTHPALGAISPDEFIPLAEASGFMSTLTSSVLRQALTACKGWQRRAGSIGVAVNVSADTVLDPGFVTEVAALLTSVGLPAELLTLELTEGVVLADPVLAVERMNELRALGLRISVDDFGTGYSSLTYLKGLPVDEVKIDKGFVNGLGSEPADRAVVRAVVDIAHTLGLKVVAEGVEQPDQHGMLRALGVDEVQGYLHARPMPAIEVAAWLRSRGQSTRL